MLHEFITMYREAIITKSREKLTARPSPSASANELEHGVPLFLTQLSETLQWEGSTTPESASAIGSSATRHGRDLRALGFTVSQVVHDYGDICQAITELALDQNAPITTSEFHTLNRCLDTAIADAVTEHARITAELRSTEEVERAGQVAHEVRDMLNTALLAFQILKRGDVAVNGSTGAILGRTLIGLRDFTNSTLAEVRLDAKHQRRERVLVAAFLNEIAAAATLHAEYRALQFALEPVDPAWAVHVDLPLLTSAVTNLLNNAFKYTLARGRVVLRARHDEQRLLIEVEDQCGGVPHSDHDDAFRPFGDQRGKDRTGLGLGLSMARKAVRAHGGDIHIRNMPGKGCVFVIDVPLAAEEVTVAAPTGRT